jgi:DNA-binding LacI/PurR family transcriptional regulator
LTTIDQPAREIGSRAAELLLQEMLDPEIPRDRCVVVPTSLVVRDTGKRTL